MWLPQIIGQRQAQLPSGSKTLCAAVRSAPSHVAPGHTAQPGLEQLPAVAMTSAVRGIQGIKCKDCSLNVLTKPRLLKQLWGEAPRTGPERGDNHQRRQHQKTQRQHETEARDPCAHQPRQPGLALGVPDYIERGLDGAERAARGDQQRDDPDDRRHRS